MQRLKEKKRNTRLPLEDVVRNNGFKHGTVKAPVRHVEDQITREAAVESARIIVYCQISVNR